MDGLVGIGQVEYDSSLNDDEATRDVEAADIPLDPSTGFLSGTSGAVVNDCYHADIPTITLVVKAHPFLPDPEAARAVIEKALEPLVDFEIDTQALQEEADEIRQRLEQVAQHYKQLQEGTEPNAIENASMYQ